MIFDPRMALWKVVVVFGLNNFRLRYVFFFVGLIIGLFFPIPRYNLSTDQPISILIFFFQNQKQQTCQFVCTFLGKVNQTLSESITDGKNLTLFSIEVVTGIRWLLLDHFKKFPVNAPGGLLVTKDLTRYATTLRTFGPIDDPVFLQSLDLLTEIGNLFVIGPEALKDRLKGISGPGAGSGGHPSAGAGAGAGVKSAFSGIDRAHLKPFLLKREDAGSVSLQTILNSL